MRTDLPAVLTKIKSNHNGLSRDFYTGWLVEKPRVGEQVHMDTREEGALWTTPVKAIRFISSDEIEFDTKNSSYRLQYTSNELGNEVYISPIEAAILSVFLMDGIVSNLAMIGTLKALEKKLLGRGEYGA